MSRTNETRHIKRHETRKHETCKCRLDARACNNKQCWNDDKCLFQCKELIEKVYVIKNIFGINIGIATYFIYYKHINHNKENVSVYDYVHQRKNY